MLKPGLLLCLALLFTNLSAQSPDTATLAAIPYPCQTDARMQKLDFWLGEWDVYVADTLAAYSQITKSRGGCTLHEDYVTVGGYTGRSMNYYDPVDSLYKQIWIDHNNAISYYHELEAGPGYLKMETHNNGLIHMSYRHDAATDTVTQTLDSSTDGGKTWNTVFTGVYRRKKE